MRVLPIAIILAVLGGCSADNPYYDATRRHHTPEGFRNNYAGPVQKSFADLLRWRWNAWRNDLPPAPREATPVVKPDLAFIARNAQAGAAMEPALTWIGHATMLVQASGLNVLTDPVFSERASPVSFAGPQRAQAPGLALGEIPHIDVVLISHNHYDHLDRDSIAQLARQAGGPPLFLVPLGIKPWMVDLGVTNVIELDWGQVHAYRGAEFHFAPVQHWSGRGLSDRSGTLWGGWAIFGADFQWYFSGDTGYSQDFVDTRRHFAARQGAASGGGFDVALVAVGSYEPRWFMQAQHVNPAEAVQIHRDLGAKRSVGIHWGTFNLTDEALDQPPRELHAARAAAGLADDEFSLMAIGATRRLPRRQ